METHQIKLINKIKISADLSCADSPKIFGARDSVKLKSGDSAVFDFLLMNSGKLADISTLENLTLEILDVGEINAPLPREVKLLARKTVAKNDINEVETAESFADGHGHVAFFFSAEETIFSEGYKWISLFGYTSEGMKSTFAQGWISVCEQYTSDCLTPPEPEFPLVRKDYADANYLNKSRDLSDLNNISAARDNLDVYSKSESDLNFLSALKKSDNLSDLTDKSTARENLEVYGKSESDAKFELVENCDKIRNDIARVMTDKSTRPSLHFNGGRLSGADKQPAPPFTLNFSYKRSVAWGNINGFLFLSSVSSSDGVGVYHQTNGFFGLSVGTYSIENQTKRKIWADSMFPTDDKIHSVSFVAPSLSVDDWTCFVDGEEIQSFNSGVSVGDWTPSGASGTYAVCKDDFGEIDLSRIAVFNFDMSVEDAPYGVADYASGKAIPPNLLRNVLNADSRSAWYPFSYHCTVSTTENTITVTKVEGASSDRTPVLDVPIYAGDKLKFRYDSIVGMNYMSLALRTDSGGNIIKQFALANTDYEIIAPSDATRILLIQNDIPDSYTITGLKISINGALLALEDCLNGAQVRDKSAGANHAAVSGNILADVVKNPAMCSDSNSFCWAGTATTQKFLNSDKSIPANSIVNAYAKATSGGTFSFKCSSNAAETKQLSANTLAKIGEWANDSVGSFLVTPSSNYEGTVKVLLKIEKM